MQGTKQERVKPHFPIPAMATVAVRTLACFLFLSALFSPYVEAAITCEVVRGYLIPCFSYLRRGGVVPPNCCEGVRKLNAAASTPADRKGACECLKRAAAQMPGLNYTLAAGLPSACGVNIPYKISPSTDCSKVK